MPRIAYFDNSTDTVTDWQDFCASIDSDSDPRESKRPTDEDEWEDEDGYGDEDDRAYERR